MSSMGGIAGYFVTSRHELPPLRLVLRLTRIPSPIPLHGARLQRGPDALHPARYTGSIKCEE